MTELQALFLGILQGLTEFLPISSSGHLVLAESFLNLHIKAEDLQGFDVLLHAATALALLLTYHKTWLKLAMSCFKPDHKSRRLLILLIAACIPAGIAGVFLQDYIAESFRSPGSVATAFCITGLVLLFGPKLHRGALKKDVSRMHALVMGCAQALAIVPGFSRSGFTIASGEAAGLHREKALDFSFLMATPVILGAALLTFKDVLKGDVFLPRASVSITGVIASFVSSIVAIVFLKKFVARFGLEWFAAYLIPLGLAVLWHVA